MNFDNVKKVRENIGISQTQFWSPLGVTQSGGSRYESGRIIPKPVRELMLIRYGTDRERSVTIKRLTTV